MQNNDRFQQGKGFRINPRGLEFVNVKIGIFKGFIQKNNSPFGLNYLSFSVKQAISKALNCCPW